MIQTMFKNSFLKAGNAVRAPPPSGKILFSVKPVFLQSLRDNMTYCLGHTTEFFCDSIQVCVTRLATGKPEKTKSRGEPFLR